MDYPDQGLELLYNVPATRLSTWGLGGPVLCLAKVRSLQGLVTAVELACNKKWPILPLGNGSNLLFEDDGFAGMAIQVDAAMIPTTLEDGIIRTSAGLKLSSLARFARQHECYSYDSLATIPGNVGGSVVNNAGAFGHEVSEFISYVEGFDWNMGQVRRIPRSEIEFSYRKCSLRGKILILEAGFIHSICPDQGFAQMNKYRKATQPLKQPSAGCVFKNPAEGSAGQLIDRAGLKSLSVGGAMVSDVHANFLVNRGDATAADVKALVELVQLRVNQEHGVSLVREIQFASEAVVNIRHES